MKKHWDRSLSDTEILKYTNLRKFLTQWVISLENETMREKQVSGSKSTNSKSNLKDKKSREWKELSVITSLRMLNARCARKATH